MSPFFSRPSAAHRSAALNIQLSTNPLEQGHSRSRIHSAMKLLSTFITAGQLWSSSSTFAQAEDPGVDFRVEGDKAPIVVGNPVAVVERDGKTVHLFFTVGGATPNAGLYYTSKGRLVIPCGVSRKVYENGTGDYCEKISIVQVDRARFFAGQAVPAGGAAKN